MSLPSASASWSTSTWSNGSDASKPGRQLAQAAAEMMTPRNQIVFERLRENSDIVLIDLPQMTPDRWKIRFSG